LCGICGKVDLEPSEQPVTRFDIHRMCQPVVHRGPDEQGIYVDGVAGLGIRRLSIMDLSTGSQPLHNEDGTIWTVVNGEIYNFRELRSLLESKGHRFHTNSDIEVVPHLYEEYGEDFVERINGMFGLALWDSRTRTMILARDRIGIKPLYYALDYNTLLFGSELKSLLAAGMRRDIDTQALGNYLSFNYIPGPDTIYRAARKLQPGHMLVARDRRLRMRQYWTIPAGRHLRIASEAACEEMIREGLKASIKKRLMADVPLGIFLSGGVDSSTILALASEISSTPMRTFSIDFGDRSFSEVDTARATARRYGSIHREETVEMRPLEILPKLAEMFDEPFADSSAIPVYYVSKMAREDVTVALGGDGGDELFAGYHTYTAGKLAAVYRALPSLLNRRMIPWLVNRMPVSHKKCSFDLKAKKFIQGALNSHSRSHFMWKMIFSEEQKAALCPMLNDTAAESFGVMEYYFQMYGELDKLTQWQYVDTRVYLPDDILTKVDRMTMANSLEGRVPFLDHEFVELVSGIPPHLKMKRLSKKYILRRAMRRRLPREVLHGRKQGFSVPMSRWLRGELRGVVAEYLGERTVRNAGFFNEKLVQSMIASHNNMEVDYSRNLWGLLMFMLWHETYGRKQQTMPVERETIVG